jgi:hypothetical protein
MEHLRVGYREGGASFHFSLPLPSSFHVTTNYAPLAARKITSATSCPELSRLLKRKKKKQNTNDP